MQPQTLPLYAGDAPHQLAGGEVPQLTTYPSGNPRPHGAVVVCPGGGYGGRAPHESEPIARWLNSVGVSAVVVDYRVAPNRHPVPLLDAQRAVRWLRHHGAAWGVQPNKVGILGFSAGGHLASTVATHHDAGDPAATDAVERTSCRPDAVILCYAVVTLLERLHQGSMANLLGEDPPASLLRELSAEEQVSAATMPHFLWHTAADAAVHVANSLRLTDALASAGVPVELHVFPHGQHGLGLAPDWPDVAQWTMLCAHWLERLGFAG